MSSPAACCCSAKGHKFVALLLLLHHQAPSKIVHTKVQTKSARPIIRTTQCGRGCAHTRSNLSARSPPSCPVASCPTTCPALHRKNYTDRVLSTALQQRGISGIRPPEGDDDDGDDGDDERGRKTFPDIRSNLFFVWRPFLVHFEPQL